jgi:hypothetical protein
VVNGGGETSAEATRWRPRSVSWWPCWLRLSEGKNRESAEGIGLVRVLSCAKRIKKKEIGTGARESEWILQYRFSENNKNTNRNTKRDENIVNNTKFFGRLCISPLTSAGVDSYHLASIRKTQILLDHALGCLKGSQVTSSTLESS